MARASKHIRIIPKVRPEPDLDKVVLALLAMLDEQAQNDVAPEAVDEGEREDGA